MLVVGHCTASPPKKMHNQYFSRNSIQGIWKGVTGNTGHRPVWQYLTSEIDVRIESLEKQNWTAMHWLTKQV